MYKYRAGDKVFYKNIVGTIIAVNKEFIDISWDHQWRNKSYSSYAELWVRQCCRVEHKRVHRVRLP